MKLVTHFIAGYPDIESSFQTAAGLIDGGAYALEMQIPYSDPSADGPVIELACRKSLEKGFRVTDAFELVKRIKAYADVPVYIMSYSGIVFNMGVENFVKKAVEYGVTGLIIPDLTPGMDEGLYEAGRRAGISVVPVVVPDVSPERLESIMTERPEWIYVALRSGITGQETKLDSFNLGFLDQVKKYNVNIMAGFGIKTAAQVETLEAYCNAAIVGSHIVKNVTEEYAAGSNIKAKVCSVVKELLGE